MQQTVEKAITALDPGAVIAVGIAFVVNEEKQALGEILVSKLLRLYEQQRVGNRYKVTLRVARPDASPRLVSHLRTFQQVKWTGAKVRFGVVLTGEKLVDDVDYRDQLVNFEAEAEGGEMGGCRPVRVQLRQQGGLDRRQGYLASQRARGTGLRTTAGRTARTTNQGRGCVR